MGAEVEEGRVVKGAVKGAGVPQWEPGAKRGRGGGFSLLRPV